MFLMISMMSRNGKCVFVRLCVYVCVMKDPHDTNLPTCGMMNLRQRKEISSSENHEYYM